MSTRGCIAGVTEDGWRGVYNHMDSYPTWLGRELWAEAQNFIAEAKTPEQGIRAFLSYKEEPLVAECKAENRKVEADDYITHERPDPLFVEWVYVFDPAKLTMTVLMHEGRNRTDADGEFDRGVGPGRESERPLDDGWWDYGGDTIYRHVEVAVIDLTAEEPNWQHIECGEQFERCGHVANAHFETSEGSGNLDTATYLGFEKLDPFQDATRWEVVGTGLPARRTTDGRLVQPGTLLKKGGSGFSGSYYNDPEMKARLRGTNMEKRGVHLDGWYQSVTVVGGSEDGRQFDLCVGSAKEISGVKLHRNLKPIFPETTTLDEAVPKAAEV